MTVTTETNEVERDSKNEQETPNIESFEALKIEIHFPNEKSQTIQVLKSTLLQDIRQHVYDTQSEHFLTCFYLSDSASGKGMKLLLD